MRKVDSCECKQKKYHKKKQLYVSGLVTTARKKRGKSSLVILETGDGSFAVPINLVSGSDFKRNIKDCRIHSRDFSRSRVKKKGYVG